MNLSKYKLILSKISLKKTNNFISAKIRQFKLWWKDRDKDYWEIRQIDWRLEKIKNHSPVCFQKKECIMCGCDVNWAGGLEYGKEACEGGCFPKWMNKKEWLEYESRI